ncbi:hypothetical protein [Modicisalibacter muralis]|uniref:hypothetical protein n=1 Tax=Modicisalibacter muralis TaxID=119000 RepID=UPI00158710F6
MAESIDHGSRRDDGQAETDIRHQKETGARSRLLLASHFKHTAQATKVDKAVAGAAGSDGTYQQRQRGRKRGDGSVLSDAVPKRGGVDIQDRLSDQALRNHLDEYLHARVFS